LVRFSYKEVLLFTLHDISKVRLYLYTYDNILFMILDIIEGVYSDQTRTQKKMSISVEGVVNYN